MWHFGGFLCVSLHTIYRVNLYSTVLILAFISLDRYLAVVRATNSQATRKLLASRVIYGGVWLPAAILTIPDLVFARVQDVQNVSSSSYLFAEEGVESAGSITICQRIYPEESGLIWMAVFRFQHILVGFFLPGLVILVHYCIIIISSLSQGAKGQVLKKKKARRRCCELQQAVETWISITEALAYFHCCLNPILFAFLGVKFNQTARSTLMIIISSRWSQKTTPVTNKQGQISFESTESESSGVLPS
ncbi:hypothetical protein CRENBAI_018287 [Crenichthys baileyi]|uniref:G-protein coupled receptors family 1 profile domain-containing protein n=1 Tax=Crenichthys baileyi TaxID=28760 RepID=A0AAV9RR93_9TELE